MDTEGGFGTMSYMVKKYWWIILVVVFVGALIGMKFWSTNQPGPLDTFAQCLTEKKVTFFGAFWCPHCQAQKALFGRSARLLPYTECSTPNSQGQTQICIDKGIKSYPIWEFADGSRLDGEQTLADLAAKTSCELPAGT